MINLICDHCRIPIKDQRKAFIFSAEKLGVLKTNAVVEAVNLPEDTMYCDNLPIMTELHRMKNLYCSKCAMDLWTAINRFAEDSAYMMEDKN